MCLTQMRNLIFPDDGGEKETNKRAAVKRGGGCIIYNDVNNAASGKINCLGESRVKNGNEENVNGPFQGLSKWNGRRNWAKQWCCFGDINEISSLTILFKTVGFTVESRLFTLYLFHIIFFDVQYSIINVVILKGVVDRLLHLSSSPYGLFTLSA